MAEADISKVQELARKSHSRNDPTGWFEELYSNAQGDESVIPWANLTVNHNLASWIKNNNLQGKGKSALVVGCGLGDDAEALSELGFDVTGFDISPSAIAWWQKRFPDSQVNYVVDDLLHPNVIGDRKHDFILESYTLQALPANVRPRGIESISKLLAPQGRLLIICRGRDPEQPVLDVPFPLPKEELSYFQQLGLEEVQFEDYLDQSKPIRRFRIEYTVQ
ncbi:MAG: class I SAM-dependent methyltransferase [Pleurocapsa sp.]